MDTTISTTAMDKYINIVYIDNDLTGGRHPVVGETYELVLADTINTKYPIHGVQLHKDGRPSGWVREVDKGAVKAILARGGLCSCVITSRRDFIWDDDTCCWGTARWVVLFDPKELGEKTVGDIDENGAKVKVENEDEHEGLGDEVGFFATKEEDKDGVVEEGKYKELEGSDTE